MNVEFRDAARAKLERVSVTCIRNIVFIFFHPGRAHSEEQKRAHNTLLRERDIELRVTRIKSLIYDLHCIYAMTNNNNNDNNERKVRV